MSTYEPLLNFILDIKRRFIIRKNINQEVTWLLEICQDISSRIEVLVAKNIFNKSYFSECLVLISDILLVLKGFSCPLPISHLTQRYTYVVALKLSKIRLNLTRTVQDIGCLQVNNLTRLFLNVRYNQLEFPDPDTTSSNEILPIVNRNFNPISCDMYQLTDDASYSLVSDDGESLLNTKTK